MAPLLEGDWSDSDEEDSQEVETTVLLGVPDGSIDVDADINDVAVSRIGGRPAFLASSEPPFSSSQCKVCSNPMELLVQMWCPFEDSPMDRALYVWGCPRVGCQGRDSAVRAWRGLRFNQKYAAKLEHKFAKQREREIKKADTSAEEARKKAGAQANPFSTNTAAASANPFGLGAQVFGGTSPNDDAPMIDAQEADGDDPTSEASLITAMASVLIADSHWNAAPSYSPLYLSTVSEYLPSRARCTLPLGTQVIDPSAEDNKRDKGALWASEAYENSLDIDQVFDKFSRRVEIEPEQCVRYDLKGTPLPFSLDSIFKRLFPDPKQEPLPVTKPAFKVVQPQKRVYDSSSIPACPTCNSPRVFECQLMPNVINILSSGAGKKKMTDEERRQAVELTLKKGDKDGRGNMEWGTCMVFSCEKDCCLDDAQKESWESWREEYVLIQWDT